MRNASGSSAKQRAAVASAAFVAFSLLGAVGVADMPILTHIPEKPGMKACYVEVPIGNEITSLLCLSAGLKSLSSFEVQKDVEKKWHVSAAKGAFALARQAHRNAHPEAASLFYGAALVGLYGVPHAIPNRDKKDLCDAAEEAITAGCRIDRCEGSEGAAHAPDFDEVLRAYRLGCLRRLPAVCQWDEKKPPVCGSAPVAVRQEWSQYSRYAQALSRVPQSAERLVPVLDKWRTALENYEKDVNAAVDAGRSVDAAAEGSVVLVAGVEARTAFETALFDARSQALSALDAEVKAGVSPLLGLWKKQATKLQEAKSFEALHRSDAQIEALQVAINALAR